MEAFEVKALQKLRQKVPGMEAFEVKALQKLREKVRNGSF